MKRKDVKLEEVFRLPPGSREEMDRALERIKGRLQSNTAANPDPSVEKRDLRADRSGPARSRAIMLAAATIVLSVVVGAFWNSRVQGVMSTPDGASHWVYSGTLSGNAGGVLKLRDESRVEIRALSEVLLERATDGIRIRLDKGTIIVNAAKQRNGHLYVQTKDMMVSVVGTVFVVNAEDVGSRVAVLEGEVRVQRGPTQDQLRPGEHVATSPAMELPPVEDDVSWSRDAAEHLALLDQTRAPAVRRPSSREPEWQKIAGRKLSFETASVLSSDSRDPGAFPLTIDNVYRSTGGVFNASFPLRYYVEFAYKLSLTPEQREAWLSQVPKWVETDHFAIEAKSPINNPTKDQLRLMMQSLLAERFKLALHFEQKPMQALTLSLVNAGTLGPGIRPHAEGPPCLAKRADSDLFPRDIDRNVWPYHCDTVILMRPGVSPKGLGPAVPKTSVQSLLMAARNVTMEIMLDAFTSPGVGLSHPVVDQTGLDGNFDFNLEWTPDDTSTAFAEAVREQLGMKLELNRVQVPVLFIDHVEKPSGN
jgi:uncharacterized protein (TIGR03435 family)